MQLIRCTKKLRKEMGLGPDDLKAGEQSVSKLGGWHADLISIDHRKCVLFTNDKTLLHFLVPDSGGDKIHDLDSLFRRHLENLFRKEGVDQELQSQIKNEYRQIGYARADNRSVLNSMNDLAEHYNYHIMSAGGLQECDISSVIKGLNRMPMESISYNSPIVAFSELYGIDRSRFSIWS